MKDKPPELPVSLRDYFAAAAMQAIVPSVAALKCANETEAMQAILNVPILSYTLADAMLKERAK